MQEKVILAMDLIKTKITISKWLLIPGMIYHLCFTTIPALLITIFLLDTWWLFGIILTLNTFIVLRLKVDIFATSEYLLINKTPQIPYNQIKKYGSIFNIHYLIIDKIYFPKNILLFLPPLKKIEFENASMTIPELMAKKRV